MDLQKNQTANNGEKGASNRISSQKVVSNSNENPSQDNTNPEKPASMNVNEHEHSQRE